MSRLSMKDGRIVIGEQDEKPKNTTQKTNTSNSRLSMVDGRIVLAEKPAANKANNQSYLQKTQAAQREYQAMDDVLPQRRTSNVMDMAIDSLRNRVANSTIGRAANEWTSRVSGNIQNVLNESPEYRAAKRQARADNEARRQQFAIDTANIIDQASAQYEGPTRIERFKTDLKLNDMDDAQEHEFERTVRNERYNPLSREERDALINRYADAVNGNVDANTYQQILYDVTKNGGIEQLLRERQADAANDREYSRILNGNDVSDMTRGERFLGSWGNFAAGTGEQIATSGIGLYASNMNTAALNAANDESPASYRNALDKAVTNWYYGLVNGADDPGMEENIRRMAAYVGGDSYADNVIQKVRQRAEEDIQSGGEMGFSSSMLDEIESDDSALWRNLQGTIEESGVYDALDKMQTSSQKHIQRAKDINNLQDLVGGNVMDTVIEGGVSTAQNMFDAGLAATLGLSGAGAIAMIPFALRAYGGSYAEQINQARELGQMISQDVARNATRNATASAAIEVGTELMWGIVGAMSKVTGGGALDDAAQQKLAEAIAGLKMSESGIKTLQRIGEKALGGFTEGLEEVIGDAATRLLTNMGVMTGELTDYSEWVKEVGHSFVLGALGGLMGEVTGLVSSPVQQSQIGKQLKAGGLDISLSELADLANSEGMENTSLAKAYSDVFSGMPRNIENISDLEAGKLYTAYEEMLGKRTEAIDRIEQLQAKVEAGEELTRADVNRITNNSDAVAILAENGAVSEDAFKGGINERRDAVEMALRAFANDSTALSETDAENVQAETENANTAVSAPNPFLTMSNSAIDNIVQNAQPMSPAQSIRESNASNMLAENVLRSAARVVDAAERLNVSERGQDVMARMYSPNMDAIDYVGEMTKYYNQGKEGKTFDVGSIEGVSAIQAQAAFNAGRQEYIERSNNGEEGLRVRTSSERQNGQSAGGSVGVLEESTGAAQGRQIRPFQREGGNARVSAESLRTEGAKAIERSGLRIVTNDSSVATAKKYAEDRGVNFVAYAGGALNIDGVQSRGYYDSDTNTVYVRADHRLFTAEQIAKHETTHAQIHNGKITLGEVNRETVDFATVRDALVKELTQERFDEMVDAYVEMYAGTNLSRQDIFEELICDSVAGMNDFVSVGHLEEAVKFAPSMSKAKAVAEAQEANGTRAGPAETNEKTQRKTSAKLNATLKNVEASFDAKTESAAPTGDFSRDTWNESEYVIARNKAAKELATALGVTQKKAKEYIDNINGIAKAIGDDAARLDYKSSPGRSSFVSNAEYGGSFDFSTLCKKRRLMTGTMTAIQNALPNTVLTPVDFLKIRNMMLNAGLEASCGLCYVEGSRAGMGQFTKEFIRLYKKYYPNQWAPTQAEMSTPDSIEDIRLNHPEVYEEYENFWNNHGKLRESDPNLFASQQKPKLYQLRTAYNGEVLKYFKKDSTIDTKNRNGGVRMQSFSDFEIVHLIDTMQIIMDMSRVGLAGQAYTKVPDFALALGNTGLKINLSLITKGVDANGKLIFDDREGMNHETAFKIRDQYSKNVGTILVTFTDEQLKAAMADDRVDFIIPFHRSQWKKSQYAAMGLPANTKDYTYQQNEKWLDQSKHKHEWRGKMVDTKVKNYMPNEWWQPNLSGKENAEYYLKMCARDGKRPKFYKFLDYYDGQYHLKKDGSTDGYWKLLIDFKMYDNDGNFSPQMPVRPDFNMGEANRMLDSYEGGHEHFPVAQGIVDDFVKEYQESHKSGKLSRDLDTQYMAAAESGDTETAAKLVKQAAEKAGYTIDAWHGTLSNFTVFDRAKADRAAYWGAGFYLTNSREEANDIYANMNSPENRSKERTGNDSHAMHEYLRIRKPYYVGGENETSFIKESDQNRIIQALNDALNYYYTPDEIDSFDGVANNFDWLKEEYPNGFTSKELHDELYTFFMYGVDGVLIENRAIRSLGYDGIVAAPGSQMFRNENNSTHYVVFDPEQIKSADPITYDDDGNIIPLEDRFNPKNDDIRYSRDLDSAGNQLTEQQAEYFKDSKVRDENGNLLVMYHGTDADFNIFDFQRGGEHGKAEGFGIYLADDRSISEHYGGRIIESYANITRPARSDSKTIKSSELAKLIKAACLDEAKKMAEDYGGKIADALRDTWVSNYVYTYDKPMDAVYREVANNILRMNDNDMDIVQEVMAGMAIRTYDAAMSFYNDILTPTTGIDGFITNWSEQGSDNKHLIALAFNSNQVKNTDNQNPTENPDIRFSRDLDTQYMAAAESGDTETAAKLVKQAAEAAGYTVEGYHGTLQFGFTKIDRKKSDYNGPFFVTADINTARTYSTKDEVTNINRSVPVDEMEAEVEEKNKIAYNEAISFGTVLSEMAGIQGWADIGYIQESLNDIVEKYAQSGNEESFKEEMWTLFDNETWALFDAIHGHSSNGDDMYYRDDVDDYDEWIESDETKRLRKALDEINDAYVDWFDALRRYYDDSYAGNYHVYINPSNLFVLDCKGRQWNSLEGDGKILKETNYGRYWNTRSVGEWAEEHGYDGVLFHDVVDDGGRGTVRVKKPADVYALFNPQAQVKSADPITYDEDGNIIPLEERFNPKNDDIRFSRELKSEATREAGEKLTERQFYSLYSAHKLDMRKQGDIEEQIQKIRSEGFKGTGGFTGNVMPTNLSYKVENGERKPANVSVDRYAPRKGDRIMFVPRSGINSATDSVKLGYRPMFDYEIVTADYDYQPYYEMYSKAYDATSAKFSRDLNSDGKQLTKGQQEFFKDSQARDEQGRLLVLYHGTPNAGFNTFKPGITWLTTSKRDADAYGGNPAGKLYDPDEDRSYPVRVATIADLVAHPRDFKMADIKRAFDAYDQENAFGEEDYTKADYIEALKQTIEDDPEAADIEFRTESKRGTEDTWIDSHRTYELYANATNPMVVDLHGNAMYNSRENGYRYVDAWKDSEYDSLIIKNTKVGRYEDPATLVLVRNPNQVALTTNENPTSDPDIRFSRDLSNTELYEANRQLQKDVTELRQQLKTKTEQYKYWKGQTKVTEGRQLRIEDVTKLAREIIKGQESSADAKAVAEKMKALGEYLLNSQDENVYDEARLKAYEVAHDILANAKALNSKGGDDFYGDFRTALKNQTIYVAPSVREEVAPDGWNDFRKAQFGTVNMTADQSKGKSVDKVYHDLQATFGEWLLPEYITSEADQLNKILEVIETYRPVYENLNSYEMADAVEWTANEILTRIIGEEIRETNPTYADRMEKKLADQKAKAQTALTQVRQQRDRKVADLKAHYQQVAEDRRNRKIDSENRSRLLKIARRLNNKKLDRVTRGLLDQYIGELDLVSKGILGRTVKELETLQAWYDSYKESMGDDFIPDKYIERKIARLSKKHISDLTQEEVADLTTVLLNLETMIRTQNQLIESQIKMDAYAAGVQTIDDINNSNGRTGFLNKYISTETATPEREIHRITGYRDSSPLYKAAKELSDGQRKMLDYQRRAEALFKKWTTDKKFIRRIAGKHAEEITVSGYVNGQLTDVKITPAMRMALYLHEKNDDNMRHISKGGVKIPDMALYKKGKLQEAYDKATRVVFTRGMLKEIASKMSADEKAFADAVDRYYNGMSRNEINDTSEALRGYAIAGVEHYYPIDTDGSFLKKEFDAIKRDGSIEGMGILKERIEGATNPIMLYDMNDTLNRSISQHSKYVGLAIPVRNFNKLYGVTTHNYETSVAETLKKNWGSAATSYIEKMMADVQNGTGLKSDAWGDLLARARSKYAGAVLTTNASVAMKQAASYPTAAAVVGYKALGRALADFRKYGDKTVDMDKLAEYTPLYWYRSKGFVDPELGDIGKAGGHIPKALNWIQGIDMLTTRKLAKAAMYYVLDNNKDLVKGTDAWWKEVAKVYNRIIEETQPNYTMMQRPQILRSDNALTRALQMFKTQPFQNFNILYDAFGNLAAKSREYKANATEENLQALKSARANAARAVSSQAVSALVFALMQWAWDAFRGKVKKYRDDDGEKDLLSWLKGMGINVLSSAGGMIPFGSYVLELGETMTDAILKAFKLDPFFDQTFYGMSENASSSVNDMGKAMINMVTKISQTLSGGEVTESTVRSVVDSMGDIAQFAGIPVNNVIKLAQSIGRNVYLTAEGRYVGGYHALRLTTDPARYSSDYYDLLWKAYNNDKAAYDEVLQLMLDDGFEEDKIKSAMEKRMKDAQGVSSVKDLESRWMAPTQQKTYDEGLADLEKATMFQAATDDQQKEVMKQLYDIAIDNAAGKKISEVIEGGKSVGLDTTEYLLYQIALQMADTPNKSGNLGSYSQEETEAAILMIPGLTKEERIYLYDVQWPKAKTNPFK